nr:hypothetical protein [Tanacetum cinerariifolium]
MSPRRLKRRAIERMVQKWVAEAIAEYKRNQTNPENVGGSGPTNATGVDALDVHGCSHSGIVSLVHLMGLRTLIVKGDDIEGYNNRFHELALMCPDLVTPKKKNIERYVRGILDRVKANVTSSKPVSLHDAINMARELIEQAIQAKATRMGESIKRKWEDYQRNNNNNNNRNNNTYH